MELNSSSVVDLPREQRPYRRYGAAITAWRSGRREALMAGPAATGKSRACLEKLHYCMSKYPHSRGLMLRKTRTSLTQSAMVSYEEKVLPQGWLGNLIRFKTQEQQYEYPNGSIIAVGGLDNADKIQSSEWDFVYVQEATELTIKDWEVLTKCLRNHQMPYQQLLADCNPSYPTHWLKQRCDRGVTQMIESRHEDNPTLTLQDMQALDNLTGVRKERLRYGRWAAAEGQVFENWDTNVHKVSKEQLVQWSILRPDGSLNRQGVSRVLCGVDWGWTNPGTLNVFALDGDERMYLLCEVYMSGKTIDWWVEQALHLQREFGIERFICDPSGAAYIAEFNGAGLTAIGANNDIIPGIDALQRRLRVAGDGRARFYLYEYSLRDRDMKREAAHEPVCFEQEIDSYVWQKSRDGAPIKELPVKVNDHSLDNTRYVVNYLERPQVPLSDYEPHSYIHVSTEPPSDYERELDAELERINARIKFLESQEQHE
jgi:hypothetical protein